MGSDPSPIPPFGAAAHSATVHLERQFQNVISALVWIAEQATAPAGEYLIATVRDGRGVLIAATDTEGRTWSFADDGASPSDIAAWRRGV